MSNDLNKKKITLALQGGGSYGAFTWGVIDRLLEDDRIEIVGVSGASAGALNAVALAYGMDKNGKEGARLSLKSMWEDLTYDQAIQNLPVVGKVTGIANKNLQKTFENISKHDVFGILKTLQSASQGTMLTFLNKQTGSFERALEQTVNFDELRNNKKGIPLFVSATDINAHKARIFDRSDITATAVKASCALPVIVGEVKIEGRLYWDGSFTANPYMESLKECDSNDIVIIQTAPLLERDSCTKPKNMMDRIFELRVNTTIRKDLEAIQKDNQRIKQNPKAAKELGIKEIYTHLINIDKSIKTNHMIVFDRLHVNELHDLGVKVAEQWIDENFEKLGNESTFTTNDDIPSNHVIKKKSDLTP